jgi:hypothetical protein
MNGVVRHSVYCLPTDVLDEGADAVLETVAERMGVGSVTVAAKYHAVTDVYPHNPVRKLATLAPGVYYLPNSERYKGEVLKPRPSPNAQGRDVLDELCTAAQRREMGVDAWAVLLHHDEGSPKEAGLEVNCFGDPKSGALCPANPDVRRFAELVVEDIADYPVDTVRLESAHFHGISHGHHHERLLEVYGEAALFVLGLCFCQWCITRAQEADLDGSRVAATACSSLGRIFGGRLHPRALTAEALRELCGEDVLGYLRARQKSVTSLAVHLAETVRRRGRRVSMIDQTVAGEAYATGSRRGDPDVAGWQFGIDAAALQASSVTVEVTGYLRKTVDLEEALSPLRGHAGSEFAVILRPGPPDCESAEQLQAKVALATTAGATEVNFYAYGLYRLETLERVKASIVQSR